MTKMKLMLNTLALLAVCLICSSLAQAQATRTWVSGVGDDANPCSRTAPCKTFAGAISKTAAGGEINCIDPGGFGAVTITKSITIDGGGTFASILSAGTTGVIVNAANIIVRIRNLSINGVNGTPSPGVNGINFLNGNSVYVEECVIDGFNTAGINVSSPPLAVNNLLLKNVVVRNCTTGVNVNNSGTNATVLAFDNVRITRSGNNLNIQNGGRGQISNSYLGLSALSSGINAVAGTSPTDIAVNDSTIVGNAVGITVQGATSNVRIARCVITGNGTTFAFVSGGLVSTGLNNTIMGNGANNLPAPNGASFPQQ